MLPKEGDLLGYYSGTDDEPAKKKSRRKGKDSSKDEPAEAAPSVFLTSLPIPTQLDSPS